MQRTIAWRALAWEGIEHLSLDASEERTIADGLILAVLEGRPQRVWYRLWLDSDGLVERVYAFCSKAPPARGLTPVDVDARHIMIGVSEPGVWTDSSGKHLPELDGCLDIDITVTPYTNTLPINRLKLAEGEAAEIDVAWIHVPEMRVEKAPQRYTLLERHATGARYRFDGLDSGFRAAIDVDTDGLVTTYPRLFERLR